MKTKENPSGLYTEQEIYDMFAALVSIGFDILTHDGMADLDI